MKNISFNNPYLMLVFIPLLLAIVVPFVLAFRKAHKGKGTIASLVLHILIAACASVALAGPTQTTVITQTEIVVVADISYSAQENLSTIDGYIDGVRKNAPKNSSIGLVCFGGDYELVTPLGGTLKSVSAANVDNGATDISSALDYAATLFGRDTIKRIVLITDGKETASDATAKLIASVESLYAQNIYLDAVYVDDNIKTDTQEVQITGVTFKTSTYVDHAATADALIQSNNETETPVTLTLYQGEKQIKKKTQRLTKGYNVVNFDLPTDTEGEFDYELRVDTADKTADSSSYNNVYKFTQTVSGKMNVLLISSNADDLAFNEELYGDTAEIDAYINKSAVPCVVEDLCEYDEIVLSNVNILEDISNVTSFVDALDKAVSKFGKSLVTFGDTKIQEKEDDKLAKFESLLPVEFGNSKQDEKVFAIAIDCSRSMDNVSRLIKAKQIAVQLVNLLAPEDEVFVYYFSDRIAKCENSGTVKTNRTKLIDEINALEPMQGTAIGKMLATIKETLLGEHYQKKERQVVLISDGKSFAFEDYNPVTVTKQMQADGVVTSAINVFRNDGAAALQAIAAAGVPDGEGPKYYYLGANDSVSELVFGEIANEITETVIEEYSPVEIKTRKDATAKGLTSLPAVYGFVSSTEKSDATVVLSATYTRKSGTTAEMPLYAYHSYGNGTVASFTSTLTGQWTMGWTATDSSGRTFFKNVFSATTPDEKVNYPYMMTIDSDGTYATVEVAPATLKPDGVATAEITSPDGTTTTQKLTFDSTKYFYKFETHDCGKYTVKITYTYEDKIYTSQKSFNISYSPEYDSFATYNAGSLYSTIRDRGTVTEDAVPSLENNEKEVATYEQNLTPALMIAAVALFVLDVIVRKLRWKDITNLFKRKKKGGTK